MSDWDDLDNVGICPKCRSKTYFNNICQWHYCEQALCNWSDIDLPPTFSCNWCGEEEVEAERVWADSEAVCRDCGENK